VVAEMAETIALEALELKKLTSRSLKVLACALLTLQTPL
jgi:hypothetical protein